MPIYPLGIEESTYNRQGEREMKGNFSNHVGGSGFLLLLLVSVVICSGCVQRPFSEMRQRVFIG
jgi:hypothetical protein